MQSVSMWSVSTLSDPGACGGWTEGLIKMPSTDNSALFFADALSSCLQLILVKIQVDMCYSPRSTAREEKP